jgi:hypothetical protein
MVSTTFKVQNVKVLNNHQRPAQRRNPTVGAKHHGDSQMTVRPDSAAFPYLDGEGELAIAEVGLTKRELFAALALQELLANPAVDGAAKDLASTVRIPAPSASAAGSG